MSGSRTCSPVRNRCSCSGSQTGRTADRLLQSATTGLTAGGDQRSFPQTCRAAPAHWHPARCEPRATTSTFTSCSQSQRMPSSWTQACSDYGEMLLLVKLPMYQFECPRVRVCYLHVLFPNVSAAPCFPPPLLCVVQSQTAFTVARTMFETAGLPAHLAEHVKVGISGCNGRTFTQQPHSSGDGGSVLSDVCIAARQWSYQVSL